MFGEEYSTINVGREFGSANPNFSSFETAFSCFSQNLSEIVKFKNPLTTSYEAISAILSFKTLGTLPDEKSVYYFVGIDDARFKRPVSPGDQLTLDVVIERNVRGMWKFGAQARVGEALAAEAKLMCTVRSL